MKKRGAVVVVFLACAILMAWTGCVMATSAPPATPPGPVAYPTPTATQTALPTPSPTPTRAPTATPTPGPSPTQYPSVAADTANLAAYPSIVSVIVGQITGTWLDETVALQDPKYASVHYFYTRVHVESYLVDPMSYSEIMLRSIRGYVRRSDGFEEPPRFPVSFPPGQRAVFFLQRPSDVAQSPLRPDIFIVAGGPPGYEGVCPIGNGKVWTANPQRQQYESANDFIMRIQQVARAAGRSTPPWSAPTPTPTPSSPTPTATVSPTVSLSLETPFRAFRVGEIVVAEINATGVTAPAVGFSAFVNFDPAYLDVLSVTSGHLNATFLNKFDNTAGTIDFSGGIEPSGLERGSFTLATVEFKTLAPSVGTNVEFNMVAPRKTDALFSGISILTSVSNTAIVIQL